MFPSKAVERTLVNPLDIKVGALLGLNVCEGEQDLASLDWRVAGIVQYQRSENAFADYEIVGRSTADKSSVRRLRFVPLEHPDPDSGRFHTILLLAQFDEFSATSGDGAGLLAELRENCEVFKIDDLEFYRIGGLHEPHQVTMTSATDANFDGTVEPLELVKRKLEYWDFAAEFEDGHTEFVFVELEPAGLLFRLWRGIEIDRDQITILGGK